MWREELSLETCRNGTNGQCCVQELRKVAFEKHLQTPERHTELLRGKISWNQYFFLLAAFYFRVFQSYSFWGKNVAWNLDWNLACLQTVLPAFTWSCLPPHCLACLHTALPATRLSYLPSHCLACFHTVLPAFTRSCLSCLPPFGLMSLGWRYSGHLEQIA